MVKIRGLAINSITNEQIYLTAFDAIYLRENDHNNFKNYKFYNYQDISPDCELVPKYLKKTSTAFFAYKSGETPKNQVDEGESLTHFVAKKALAKIKNLHLIDVSTSKEYFINTEFSKNEKHFKFDKSYYADVYYDLSKTQNDDMKKYYYKWYNQLVIEVLVSHKTSKEKYKAFSENMIPIFEVEIPQKTRDKFNLEGHSISKRNLDIAIQNMEKMFLKGIRGKFISYPASPEYKLMSRYKNEINSFKKTRDKALKEYITSKEKLDILNSHIELAKANKEYYDNLETRIKELENQVSLLEKEIEDYKKHPPKFLSIIRKNKH